MTDDGDYDDSSQTNAIPAVADGNNDGDYDDSNQTCYTCSSR